MCFRHFIKLRTEYHIFRINAWNKALHTDTCFSILFFIPPFDDKSKYQPAPFKWCRQLVHPHFYFEVRWGVFQSAQISALKQTVVLYAALFYISKANKQATYVRMYHVPTMSYNKRRFRWGWGWERWQRELVRRRRSWVHGFSLQSDFRYVEYLQVEVISVDK